MVEHNRACLSWRREKHGQSRSWFHVFEGLTSHKGGRLVFSLIAKENVGPFGELIWSQSAVEVREPVAVTSPVRVRFRCSVTVSGVMWVVFLLGPVAPKPY